MVFEGIVIHKIPYKERDLIVKLILRSGLLGSFYVYGGQGGGKHHKPTILELGSMMKIMIKEQRGTKVDGSDLMIASEYQRLWEPSTVRHNVQAYYLECLYFEILQKLPITFKLGVSDNEQDHHEGVFLVISNALFQLEDAVKKNNFVASQHLMIFLVKLLHHLGIMPDTDHCSLCGVELMSDVGITFLPAEGQFACIQCMPAHDEKGFLLRVKKSAQTKYADYAELTATQFNECDKLIQYFCQQFNLRPVELKCYSLLLK